MTSKTNLLILGGTGFIGRNLVETFSKIKKYKVYSTFNKKKKFNCKNVNWIKCDLLKKKNVEKALKKKDIVIQAASVTTGSKDVIERPYLHVTDNILMNTILLRAIHENKIKNFIFFSCTVMYNSSSKNHKETSKNIVNSSSPYYGVASMKMYIEKQSKFYSTINKTKYSILRHSNIFGPYDKFNENSSHVLSNFIKKSIDKNKVFNIWGDGKSIRDFLFIKDLINAVEIVLERQTKNFEIFNVGSESPISIKQLAKNILKKNNVKKKINYIIDRPYIKNYIKINCNKIKKLGWKKKYTLEKGLEKTINWFKKIG